MARIVLKFGGTSVADIGRIEWSARHVAREIEQGHEVAVLVSAMAGETNRLVALCREASLMHDAREYDVVVSSGEQVAAGLMAIALQKLGIEARSWLGWQLPIRTDAAHAGARISEIVTDELMDRIRSGQTPVIGGFQGLGPDSRISTLGRGGTDTSAVAVAAAIGADRCDIYTDVDGIYTTDPRIVPAARRLARISYEEILEMASLGAKVMSNRAVELALIKDIKVLVRSSFDAPEIKGAPSEIGTIICPEDEILEKPVVTGVACALNEAQISLRNLKDKAGVADAVFTPLAKANINVDMIVQSISPDNKLVDITFTLPITSYELAMRLLEENREPIGLETVEGTCNLAKISVIGVGMRSHAGVAARGFRVLAQNNINIRAISTSEIKLSVLIDKDYAELAVRALHAEYGLGKASV